jgi:hypothetical protein
MVESKKGRFRPRKTALRWKWGELKPYFGCRTHGKHHDMVARIAAEIEARPDGEALRIPLDGMQVSLANLRSAISRAMTSRRVKIGTFSDGESLCVWRKTAGTARYERKRRSR